jgi:hypothetical protein
VHFFFDESGDYRFAEEFDCYAQAGLICPDSQLDEVNGAVERKRDQLGVPELHAAELEDDVLVDLAQLIHDSELQLLADVTDTVLVNRAAIAEFRLDQAGRTKRNLDWYEDETIKLGKEPDPQIRAWMNRRIKLAGLRSQISDGEFVQAHYMIELIASALQRP